MFESDVATCGLRKGKPIEVAWLCKEELRLLRAKTYHNVGWMTRGALELSYGYVAMVLYLL